MASYLKIAATNAAPYSEQYKALADVTKVIHVDPQAITHHCPFHMLTKRQHGSKLLDWGKILDGDWDLDRREKLRTGILTEQLRQHFLEGLSWDKTGLIEHKLRHIAKHGKVDGCTSRDELIARYGRLDALFETIKKEGRLRTAKERGEDFTDDLFVSIGRDGSYLFAVGGSHRLSIAQLLELPMIPVSVVMRHRQWQDIRERAKAGKIPRQHKNHPDLAEFSQAVCASKPRLIDSILRKRGKKELVAEMARLTNEQNWMHNMPMPFGLYTVKKSTAALSPADNASQRNKKIISLQARGAKEGLLCALDFKGKTILDVACGEGKYSFAAAPAARHVLGIDIDPTRIEKANLVKSAWDVENVDFKVMDLYSDAFKQLPSYDYALCLGLIHRLPDPFNFLNSVAAKSKAVLIEWIGAPGLLSQDVSWAYHGTDGLYEWQNAHDNFESKEVASKGRAGGGVNRASYWNMSYAAVEALCARAGHTYFLRFSRAPNYPDYSRDPEKLTRRVMLLASREPIELFGRISENSARPARRGKNISAENPAKDKKTPE